MPDHFAHILVATDFSDNATLAAQRGMQLAAQHAATLRVVHVTERGLIDEMTRWLGEQARWHEALNAQTQQSLHILATHLQTAHHHPAVQVQLVHREGHVVQAVLDAAKDCQADLLVLGQHGQGSVRDMVMGTTTERVLNRAALPVLVVRAAASPAYQRVLVALDLSDNAPAALALARRLAPQAHLVLMHGFSVPFGEKLRFAGVDADTVSHYRNSTRQQAIHHMDALIQHMGLPAHNVTTVLREGDAARLVTDTASHHGCDLIVISKKRRTAPDELLLGSVARHTLAEATMDVLIQNTP